MSQEWLTQEEIARRAYEAWRTEMTEPRLPAWEIASDITQGVWIARVAIYHEVPWDSMGDHGIMDRFVREAATKAGR